MKEWNTNDKSKVLMLPIQEMELPDRTKSCLKRANIDTIREMIKHTIREMMLVRNLGRKSLNEIIEKLDKYGVSFRNDEDAFLYGYPAYIKRIAVEKNRYWELRLFVETLVLNYKWLTEFREYQFQPLRVSEKKIDNVYMLVYFIEESLKDIKGFIEGFIAEIMLMDEQLHGEQSKNSDENEIITAVENMMIYYKKIIRWHQNYGQVSSEEQYRGVISNMAVLMKLIFEFIDYFYNKCVTVKEIFCSYFANEMSGEELHINLKTDLCFLEEYLNIIISEMQELCVSEDDEDLVDVVDNAKRLLMNFTNMKYMKNKKDKKDDYDDYDDGFFC